MFFIARVPRERDEADSVMHELEFIVPGLRGRGMKEQPVHARDCIADMSQPA